MVRFGYCCINLTLNDLSVNRGMIRRTFDKKGKEYAGELAEKNIKDLIEIIKWNYQHGIQLYRMSSSMFPWMTMYRFEDLPNYETIKNLLKGAGALAKKYGQRLTFHPGQFNILTSAKENVVQNSIDDLSQHANIMDLMGLPQTHEAPINIHTGGVYGEKEKAIERFINNFDRLPDNVKSRLVLENDDKPNQYGVKDIYGIYQVIGTPITFDYHHHFCHQDPMPEEEAISMASETWPAGIRQLCHYSSAKKIFEDNSVIIRSHADYIYNKINFYGLELDIELEAKAKELALFRYLNEFEYIKNDENVNENLEV